MKLNSFSVPRIWGILSRTRHFSHANRQQRSESNAPKGIWNTLNKNFWYFLYQGVGVTAPFGLCYVIGVIVGGIGGEGILVAILIAMIASLLTGLCYSEFITSNRHCSGTASTAIYQMVGEFPAFTSSVLSFLISCSCFAAMSKALSSTMDELSHERFSVFLTDNLGALPLSGLPPDILAFGAALVTSVLLACGLKQAGVLRTAMNLICLMGFTFFLSVGGSHTRTANSKVEEHEFGYRQILVGSGICCCIFTQFLELGRRSKGQSLSSVRLPLAISITSIGVLCSSFALATVLAYMMDNRLPVSGAPLLRAFQLRDVGWARLLMGSIQIITIGLGISEAGEMVCRHLVTMATDGFIPSFFSLECPLAFSYSRAHLLGGICASLLALLLTHVYLLQFMAANILLLNILIIVITLYRPYRCSYDSLCSVAVTTSSKVTPTSRLNGNQSSTSALNSDRTINFLKTGIRVLAFNKADERTDGELRIPLLSALQSSAEPDIPLQESCPSSPLTINSISYPSSSSTERSKADSELMQISQNGPDEGPPAASEPGKVTSDAESNESELLSFYDSQASNNEESDEDLQGPEEIIPEEDIDTIVSEYKEQLRISTMGSKIKSFPTKETARKALFIITALATLSIFLCSFSFRYFSSSNSRAELSTTLKTIFILVCLIVIFTLLLLLTRLPTLIPSQSVGNGFRVPGSSWTAFVALFMNGLLITEVFSRTAVIILPLYISAIVWYTLYSSRHSAVVTTQFYGNLKDYERRGKENEMVCLSPILPGTFYASQPQRTELNRNI